MTLFVGACWIAGCSAPPTPPYPKWTEPDVRSEPTGAFAAYLQAADDAERIAGKEANRVSYTPGMKQDLIQRLAPALSTVSQARGGVEFVFESRDPFEDPPHHKGWWMIGQAFAWRIERQIINENYDGAISDAITATQFGFGLTGGSAIDASLGYSIVDLARRAIAPALPKLGAAQLQALASGIQSAHAGRPSMSAVVQHERLNMLRAVQKVQDLYRDKDLKLLTDKLGTDVADAVTYLEQLRPKDASKRPSYFQGFADEAETQCKWLARLAPLSAEMRAREPEPELASERPWRRFARYFFGALSPLFQMRDASLARTRLLVLEALVLKQVKMAGAAPKDLSAYPESITADPFSGRGMIYRAEGADYRLYSVGEDLKDDGGETNERFESPDMKLER